MPNNNEFLSEYHYYLKNSQGPNHAHSIGAYPQNAPAALLKSNIFKRLNTINYKTSGVSLQ